MGLIRLESVVQHYDWGSFDALSNTLGRKASGRPEAELWMGAHARGPSLLATQVGEIHDLAALIKSDPGRYLGEHVAKAYGHLPFLFKVLAAGSPLSLQAHPNREQAQLGFDAEQQRGVPVDANVRNYRDRSHKPELICALTRFSALSGFRPPGEAAELVAFFLAGAETEVRELVRVFAAAPDSRSLAQYFQAIFALSGDVLGPAIASALGVPVTDHASPAVQNYAPWLIKLARLHPRDPGVLASMLLNVVELAPGEAMYLPAGNLHAYLEGVGLELMACSDNVLRGGLTSKHVDVAELFKVLVFSPAIPEIQRGTEELGAGVRWRRFATPAEEFELSLLELNSSVSVDCSPLGPEIWLGLEGEIELVANQAKVRLSRGDQVFVCPGVPLKVSGQGAAARSALPRGA